MIFSEKVILSSKRARGVWTALVGPGGWRAVAWPAAFAMAALLLLIFDHLQQRITQLVFWLCVGLIACVFAWLVETARRQTMALASERRLKLLDVVTGLPTRTALQGDLAWTVSAQRERRTLVVLELEGLQAYYDGFGSATGDGFVSQIAGRLVEAVAPLGGTAYRIDATRFAAVVPADGRAFGENLLAAISPQPGEHASDLLIGRSYGEVSLPEGAEDPEVALQIAGQNVTDNKQRQQRSARRQAHAVLMAVLDARRPDLREHLRSIAYRSISLSRRLGLDRHAIDDIFLASELQDIGLLAVPEAVLEKKGPLDVGEASLIRNHPVAGERIVASAPGLASVAALVRSTPERFDGRGYPDGLAGEEIPLGARIIAVCVAFAAMTSHRPYQAARSEDDVLDELQRCAGSQFDPLVVEALVAELGEELGGATATVGAGIPGLEPISGQNRVPATVQAPGEAD
ncbi:MAG: diguanylate cyclase [Solirubrobacterales bacterium]|nr:diguanylate cyclase [Solirubrobacterales bacterium]